MGLFDEHDKLDPIDQLLDADLDGEVTGADYYIWSERFEEERRRREVYDRLLEEIDESDRIAEERSGKEGSCIRSFSATDSGSGSRQRQGTAYGQSSLGGQSSPGGQSASSGQSFTGGQSSSGGQSSLGGQNASSGQSSTGGQSVCGGHSSLGGTGKRFFSGLALATIILCAIPAVFVLLAIIFAFFNAI